MKKLTQENLKEFISDFETAFFESKDNSRQPECTFELKDETAILPNPKIFIEVYLIVSIDGGYRYCYFEVELFFKLTFKKEINGEMKNIYIKCNYPLVIHTRGNFDYEDYYIRKDVKSHLLYPNMKKLSNYLIIKIISMIIEKGKEVDIIITEKELFPIFDDNIRKNILEQGTFVQGANYHSM